eukprot:COSAG06_NODE_5612_length_3363_cov_1.493566_4_plen_115_part_00
MAKGGLTTLQQRIIRGRGCSEGEGGGRLLRHWIEGLEYAPGKSKYAEGNMIGLGIGSHSFTGQIATFLADYYYYDGVDVSINQIRDDVTAVGDHNPSALMQSFTDESMFRFLGQ